MYKLSEGKDGRGVERIYFLGQGLRALTQYGKSYNLYYKENLDSKWILIK